MSEGAPTPVRRRYYDARQHETASLWLCDSCRQVDTQSNKYTNNCQGAGGDKARRGGDGGEDGGGVREGEIREVKKVRVGGRCQVF